MLDSCWLSAIKVCTAAGVFSLDTVCCHLAGFASVLEGIRNNNDLGHPVCENLRAGDWMAGYTAERLKLREDTHEVGRKLNTWTFHSHHTSCLCMYTHTHTHTHTYTHKHTHTHTHRERSTGVTHPPFHPSHCSWVSCCLRYLPLSPSFHTTLCPASSKPSSPNCSPCSWTKHTGRWESEL